MGQEKNKRKVDKKKRYRFVMYTREKEKNIVTSYYFNEDVNIRYLSNTGTMKKMNINK